MRSRPTDSACSAGRWTTRRGRRSTKSPACFRFPIREGRTSRRSPAKERNVVPMPKMLKGGGGYDFSYSGLKTAVINYVHTKGAEERSVFQSRRRLFLPARGARHARAQDRGRARVRRASGGYGGGRRRGKRVSARRARQGLQRAGLRLVLPVKKHCTDNAAMIAAEGLVQYRLGHFSPLSLNAEASIPLVRSVGR